MKRPLLLVLAAFALVGVPAATGSAASVSPLVVRGGLAHLIVPGDRVDVGYTVYSGSHAVTGSLYARTDLQRAFTRLTLVRENRPGTSLHRRLPARLLLPGTWRSLAPEPVALPYGASVWTGSRLIVFGRRPLTKTTYNPSVNAAMSFDPAANAWKTLSPPAQSGYAPGCCRAVWTGKRLLVFGANLGYDPRRNAWRPLHARVPGGIVVWTGREAIGWGGGCCGDAWSNGAAYDPSTEGTRTLPRSPLAPSQEPLGAWDGHELLVFVSGLTPYGTPYPARFARAAAYNPSTNRWRRIAPLPAAFSDRGAWTGRELIVIGAGAKRRGTFGFDPKANRWRRLARLPSPRSAPTALWTGDRLVAWGGGSGRAGLVYDPATNRWTALPQPPLRAPETASVVWTGRSLLAFGGVIGSSKATNNLQVWPRDVAALTPAARRW